MTAWFKKLALIKMCRVMAKIRQVLVGQKCFTCILEALPCHQRGWALHQEASWTNCTIKLETGYWRQPHLLTTCAFTRKGCFHMLLTQSVIQLAPRCYVEELRVKELKKFFYAYVVLQSLRRDLTSFHLWPSANWSWCRRAMAWSRDTLFSPQIFVLSSVLSAPVGPNVTSGWLLERQFLTFMRIGSNSRDLSSFAQVWHLILPSHWVVDWPFDCNNNRDITLGCQIRRARAQSTWSEQSLSTRLQRDL